MRREERAPPADAEHEHGEIDQRPGEEEARHRRQDPPQGPADLLPLLQSSLPVAADQRDTGGDGEDQPLDRLPAGEKQAVHQPDAQQDPDPRRVSPAEEVSQQAEGGAGPEGQHRHGGDEPPRTPQDSPGQALRAEDLPPAADQGGRRRQQRQKNAGRDPGFGPQMRGEPLDHFPEGGLELLVLRPRQLLQDRSRPQQRHGGQSQEDRDAVDPAGQGGVPLDDRAAAGKDEAEMEERRENEGDQSQQESEDEQIFLDRQGIGVDRPGDQQAQQPVESA